jgi:hypothetical protein
MTAPVTGEWVFEPMTAPELPPPPGPGSGPQSRRNRRAPLVRLGVLALAVMLIAAAALVVRAVGRHGVQAGVPPAPGVQALAWSVDAGRQAFVAVIAVPAGKPPVVLVVPSPTPVDIPGGGPATVASAVRAGPKLMLAAVQVTVNRRVLHYLSTDATALQALVDRLGGVEVQVEAAFTSSGVPVAPGPRRLAGLQVVAYLANATARDRTGRWEEVLAGLVSGSSDPWRWAGALGTSDDVPMAARMLAAAQGAEIVDLPTAPTVGGAQAPDSEAVANLVMSRMAGLGGPLVRVAVLNANGQSGNGPAVASLLATAGFRVTVAPSQQLSEAAGTLILATSRDFLPLAREVQSLLGAGKVYLGRQSGIADIEIVVGKDFRGN